MEIIRRENINVEEIVRKTLPKVLIKDLQENERICPVCHGLGIKVIDNVYGIHGDVSESGKRERFPYKHQSLTLCDSCYNGVQKLCEYCGEPYQQRGYYHCNCEGFKKSEEEKIIRKCEDTISKAKELPESCVTTMLYCEEWDEYYATVDDFFEDYVNIGKCDHIDKRPCRLWVCSKSEISIDAGDVIENACDDLHEDASDNCDYKSLQEFLDKWCKEQTGTTTYYPCYKEYVAIDWSKYNEDN